MATDTSSLLTWQIGSKTPPKVCLCCGLPFSEERERKGPYWDSPYIWVCSICWALPYLFFSDKEPDTIPEVSVSTTRYRQKLLDIAAPREYHEIQSRGLSSRPKTKSGAISGSITIGGAVMVTAELERKTGYFWRLGGKDYLIERVAKPLSELRFDPRNQRIQYALKTQELDPLQASQEQILTALNVVEKKHITDLYHAIEMAGGILVPLIVTHDGIVIEGNCRLASLRRLCADSPNPEYCSPPCEVLPQEFDDEARMIFLGECHVAGKKDWDAYEVGEHIYKMTHHLGKSEEFVAKVLRLSKTTVHRWGDAYEMLTEFLRDHPERGNIYKWSYFFELEKKKPLRDRAHADSTFKERFFRWVDEGKVQAIQVRDLTDLLGDEEALKALDDRGFAEAMRIHSIKATATDEPKNTFPSLEMAIHELEAMPMKELARLSDPGSEGAATLQDLHRRLNVVAKMAGISLDPS